MSFLYGEGSYGENARKQIVQAAKKNGICLGLTQLLRTDSTYNDIRSVINQLRSLKTRTVVMFVEGPAARPFFKYLVRMSTKPGEFIFVGSDSIGDLGSAYDGGIGTLFPFNERKDFREYVAQMTPLSAPDNPYFFDVWSRQNKCEYKNKSESLDNVSYRDCSKYEHLPLNDISHEEWISQVFDGFYILAHSIHNLVQDQCPEKFLDPTNIKECIKGEDLLTAIKKLDYKGISWKIKFDEHGDLLGSYLFRQYYANRENKFEPLVIWDSNSNLFRNHTYLEDWNIFWNHENSNDQKRSLTNPPDSVCSRPCPSRHYAQQKKLECCWECIQCRNNEHLNDNRTACVQCPEFRWPDEYDDMKCVDIEPE